MNIVNTRFGVTVGSLFLYLMYFWIFVSFSGATDEVPEYVPVEEVIKDVEEIPITPVKGIDDFKYDLGFKESTNRYDAVNPWGYLGKYQFSPNILWRLGFQVSREEFLSNPQLQEEAFETLLRHNYDILKPIIDKYDGKRINGIEITESGILAAAHLIGPTRTKLFLKYNRNYRDGLGTRTSDYLHEFSGYKLQL